MEVDQVDNAGGNTISPAYQGRKWVGTLSNYTEEEVDKIYTGLTAKALKWVVGKEIAPTTLTPHLQMYMEFKNGHRMQGVKNILCCERIHLEKARGDAETNYVYCTKEGNFKSYGYPPKPKDPIVVPRPFQSEIIGIYNTTPDDRKIYWRYCLSGNSGKTALAKHLCLKGKTIFVNGKASDVKCAAAKWIEQGKPLHCVIFGIPRTCTAEYVSYSAIEELKDGIFFSGKYESGQVIMDSPHVFVFANFPPDTSKLSMDRWDIKEIAPVQFHATSPIDLSNGGWIQPYLANNPSTFPTVASLGPAAAGSGI